MLGRNYQQRLRRPIVAKKGNGLCTLSDCPQNMKRRYGSVLPLRGTVCRKHLDFSLQKMRT